MGMIKSRFGGNLAIVNIAWEGSEKLLKLLVAVWLGIWIARYLGPVEYGRYNFVMAWFQMFNAVAWLGVGDNVIRDFVKNPDAEQHILGAACVIRLIGSVMAVIIMFLAAYISKLFDRTQMQGLLILCSLLPLAEVASILNLWFVSKLHSKPAVISRNISIVVSSGARLFLLVVGVGILGLFWAYFIEMLFVSFGLVIAYKLAGGCFGKWRFSIEGSLKMFKEGFLIVLSSILISLNSRIDQLALGLYGYVHGLGIYSAALRFSEIIWIMPPVIMQSIAVKYIYINKDDVEIEKNVARCVLIMAVVAIVPCVFIYALGDRVVIGLFGPAYIGAIGVLKVHIWTSIVVFIDAPIVRYLVAQGKSVIILLRSSLLVIINASLQLVLVKKYGAVGSAIGTLLTYCFVVLILPLIIGMFRDQRRVLVSSLVIAYEQLCVFVSKIGENVDRSSTKKF